MKSKCKICREVFEKRSISHKTCSPPCALALVSKDKEKAAKKELRARRVAIRSRSEWLKLAQQSFNAFIRKRDEKLPCISCGRHHQGQWHAGHYFSTGARPELRFDESNCSKQCAPCNNHLSGNIALYRQALILKVGQEEVDRLEGPTSQKKWTIPELQEIIQIYKAKAKSII